MGPAPTLLRYSSTAHGMLFGIHNSAAFVCVSFPREGVLVTVDSFPKAVIFFLMSLGLLSLKGTLVIIPLCKHLTDVQEGNRMVQEVFEKDKGGFALSKCKFLRKMRSSSEKVMGKLLSGSANHYHWSKGLQLLQRQFCRYWVWGILTKSA